MKVKIDLKGKNFEEKTEVPPKNRRNLEILDFLHYLTHIAWKSKKFQFKICRQFSCHDFLCVSQRAHKCHFYEKKVFFLTKITKYDLKYYWRHGTIKRKNKLEIKSFQAKKSFPWLIKNFPIYGCSKWEFFSKNRISHWKPICTSKFLTFSALWPI